MSERGYIDGVLSTHFDECSIAAADAGRCAENIYNGSNGQEIDVQTVGRIEIDAPIRPVKFIGLRKFQIEHGSVVGGNATIGLTRYSDDGPVVLAAVINQDVLLPLATFQRRLQGQCSYVQLGQEIAEDNLVVTPDASRTEYVESIRELLHRPDTDAPLVEAMVQQEATTYSTMIEACVAPSVCRLAEAFDKKPTLVKNLHIIEDGDITRDNSPTADVLAKRLTFVSETDPTGETQFQGRDVRLVLATVAEAKTDMVKQKPQRRFGRSRREEVEHHEPAGPTVLLAVIRGNVALKLAEFLPSGEISLGDGQFANQELAETLLKVLPNQAEEDRQRVRRLMLQYESRDKDMTLETDYKTGEVELVNRNRNYSTAVEQGVLVDWHTFREYLTEHYGLPQGMHIKTALMNNAPTNISALCEQLRVTERLEKILGPGNSEIEDLIARLGGLVSGGTSEFSGILPNRRAGKTTTHVDTKVQISNGNQQVRVVVEGRPLSLDGFDHVTIFDETLRFDARNELDDDKVSELAEVIGKICVEKAT